MLTHGDIWRAIDGLARTKGLSTSGLAKLAGLDPTTFNRSKRTNDDGKLRWPSTESIAKVLEATGVSLIEFVSQVGDGHLRNAVQHIPVLGCDQARESGNFDEVGHPIGPKWDQFLFPNVADPHAYALEISGNGLEPTYRDGDRIVLSPSAGVRRGDRVVVRLVAGEVLAQQLVRETATRIEVKSINGPDAERVLLRDEVAWMARIIWASQ